MLTQITISNLATIQSLTLSLAEGFTVLTGETGAGKSILTDAVRLVLGSRGSSDMVRTGEKQAVIEAVFHIQGLNEVTVLLDELGIPGGEELVIRRILADNGRSRAVANDCSISQPKLEQLGQYLINIHGQHDNQMLLNPATHLDFLDGYGQLLPLRQAVGQRFRQYTQLAKQKQEALEQAGRRDARLEELNHTVTDLEQAQLRQGEMEELRREHTLLTHSSELARITGTLAQLLYEGESALHTQAGEAVHLMDQAAAFDPALEEAGAALKAVRSQVEDVYRVVAGSAHRLDVDPNRLDQVNERLALLEKLARRHGGTVEAAMETLAKAKEELDRLMDYDVTLQGLEKELTRAAQELHEQARVLSERRREAAAALDPLVNGLLAELGMEKAQFQTKVEPARTSTGMTPAYTSLGMDQVEFLLASNPGQSPRPLARIASGGELSRIMLSLKSALAKADPTRTLIFDEVDQGIAGAVADRVGQKLRALGQSHQVVCITHLPQIAAQGTHHILVQKDVIEGQTYTRVRVLHGPDKVEEVARLMSGMDITPQTRLAAQEMLSRQG
ncbi:MAG: DNA repair protein RecN [Deltaproteobacteria bacterium]|nr:DNA repair protein RecN [Deltaproteobacteria bacterium]